MKRDFSDSAHEELLEIVRQVENERKWKFLDDIGDIWKEFMECVGWLKIDNYLDNISEYHKQMIDKDDKTEKDIEDIFIKVKELDQIYAVRFAAYKTMLEQLIALVDQFSNTISPSKWRELEPEKIKPFLKKYNDSAKYLKIIGSKSQGLDEEKIKELEDSEDASIMSIIVNGIGESIIGLLPDITIGEEVEIPIGTDVSIYYSASTTIEGETDFDLNVAVKEQKLKLENVSYVFLEDGSLSFEGNTDGKIGVSIANQDRNIFSNKNVERKSVKQDGNDTYEVKLTASLEEIVFEKSIKTEYEQGSITSSIGIKKKSNNSWKPLPVPVYEEEELVLPKFEKSDIHWEYIDIGAIKKVIKEVMEVSIEGIKAVLGVIAVICASEAFKTLVCILVSI